MLNPEHLRKQAKQHLRWHREGYHPVAARIRSFVPRYDGMTDPEILAAPFRLSDAQEPVACASGYESWPALMKAAQTMTSITPLPAPPVIVAAEPQLFVSDMAAVRAFYEGRLGFQLAFSYGEPAFYAQVVRGGARMNLRWTEGPVFDAAFRARTPDALSATVTLEDAKPLVLEYQAAGVIFHQALRTEPWGSRTFVIADPDVNLVLFAGRAG